MKNHPRASFQPSAPPAAPSPLAKGVTYYQNAESRSHVFKGEESALRDQIDLLGWSIDDKPVRHVVTKQVIENASKCIFDEQGQHIAFLATIEGQPAIVTSPTAFESNGGAQ